MKEAENIFAKGEHFVEPVIVESGSTDRRFVLEAGARLYATAFVLATDSGEAGGGKAKFRLTVDFTGEGAEFYLHALYITSGNDATRADIDVIINHLTPRCTSRQLIKGIATSEATGSFIGMVHVAPGAQKTDAAQRNQNLQLTDTAYVLSRPGLEIYADDVKCSHGSTVGRLDEETIYYMRQRGLSEAEARRMQMHGFAAEIVNHCPSEDSRRDIGERIISLIDRL
ncbi:MAG: SufD family Fe-S cluster assembly protein [Alistipes sp.]|jgi:Fe-S cluster assembly protein SufD|nr:SufD family Fe-S cluster assembly protein [Alistipes sp.]